MQANFYATLRAITGKKTVDFDLPERATLQELLDEILRVYPLMRPELLDENGELYQHVHIFVNGRDTPYLENRIDTRIMPDDVVSVFPAVGGG